MTIILKKTLKIIKEVAQSVQENISSFNEELRTIFRNQNYLKHYPALFAIFAIIEHEKSPHIFDLKADEFDLLRNKLAMNDEGNNHQILESLRSLFQNNHLTNKKSPINAKLSKYLIEQIREMLKQNNAYYLPLLKATLKGFPFILNYDHYFVFKKLIKKQKKPALKLLKYILENKNFPQFLINEQDIIKLLEEAALNDNKPAFMLLVRYFRQNDLFYTLFDSNQGDFQTRIVALSNIKERGAIYAAILFSYCENKWLRSDEVKEKLRQFFHDIFGFKLKIEQKQKILYYNEFKAAIMIARQLGFNNSLIDEILQMMVQNFMEVALKQKKNKFALSNVQSITPSASIKTNSFFALEPKGSEEYWLSQNASYLL